MGEPLLVAYAGAAAVVQAVVAALLARSEGLGGYRRMLALLFALNAGVAALFGARAAVGFGDATGTQRILAAWASLVDGPTPLLLLGIGLKLAGVWSDRWGGALLLLAWLPQPAWMLTHLDSPVPGAVQLAYAWAWVHVAYAVLVVGAARRIGAKGLDGRVAPWLLAAVGPRAVEFLIIDLAATPSWLNSWTGQLTSWLPMMALLAGLVAAFILLARRRRSAAGRLAVPLVFLVLGAMVGGAFVLARATPGLHVTFLSTLTLFIVRPLVAAGGLLGTRALLTAAAPLMAALAAGGFSAVFNVLFSPLPVLARAMVALGCAMGLVAAAWVRFAPPPGPSGEDGRPNVEAARRVETAREALLRADATPPDPALAEKLAGQPQPVRVLLALRGTEGSAALFDLAASQAGLCALTGVHYKKLATVLRRLEALYPHPESRLVEEYHLRRGKYYRLSVRGAVVARDVAMRVGVADVPLSQLRAALLKAHAGAEAPGATSAEEARSASEASS